MTVEFIRDYVVISEELRLLEQLAVVPPGASCELPRGPARMFLLSRREVELVTGSDDSGALVARYRLTDAGWRRVERLRSIGKALAEATS